MKKLLPILVISLLFGGNGHAKQVNLSCELTKYFFKEAVLSDEKQIPLSKVDPIDLRTATLSFDMEKKEFLDSNLIFPMEYRNVLFTDDEIYFITKGSKNNDNVFYYDTRLNRITGEMTRMIQVTENAIKKRLENNSNGPTGFGWKQTLIYQCKVVDKLF